MSERFNVNIFLHNGNTHKFIYEETREGVEDIVSKIWYTGFLDINPKNPKRKIHILPEEIKRIQIDEVKD